MKLRLKTNSQFSMTLLMSALAFGLSLSAFSQGRIAYTSFDGNSQGEIFVMNPDSSGQVNLTNNSAKDEKPTFSKYGNKIAFRSDRDGNFDIYTMLSDGSGQTRLTNTAADEDSPSFNANGTKIVFVSERDGNKELYVMDSDGSNQTRLTNNTFSDTDPSFSQDGTKIIFSSNRDGDGSNDLYTMNADGSGQTRFYNFASPYGASQASYSPDGTKIVFASNFEDTFGEIYIMNADGSGRLRLTTSTGNDSYPSFNQDGTKLVFFSQRTNLSLDLYLMDTDGSNVVPLTLGTSTSEWFPSWGGFPIDSPPQLYLTSVSSIANEGDSLTISGNMFSPDLSKDLTLSVDWGDGTQQIFNYQAVTTSFTQSHQYRDDFPNGTNINLLLSTINGSDPATAPTGAINNVAPELTVNTDATTFAVGSPVSVRGGVSDAGTLDTHNIVINWGDGSAVTQLNLAAGVATFSSNHTYIALGAYTVTVNASDDDGGNATPATTLVGVVPPPTSGKIAFTSNFGGNNNIWLMNSNGTGQFALTTNPANDYFPNISKDGRKIAFVSDRDGNAEIYTMDAAGAFQTRLTTNAAEDSQPAFSPDGSKIVFTSRRDGNYEVYIINSNGTGVQRLTNNAGDDGQAEFSPDGTKIIFSRLSGAEAHIYTMNLDGSGQTPLTSGFLEANGFPSYSPNGQKIVFSKVSLSHTNGEIYVMDANGANQQRLTTAAGNDQEAVFSPDGTKIAFRSERDGNAEIYIMDAAGTNQQRITFDGAGISNIAPSWASVPTVGVDIADDLAAEQGAALTVPILVGDTTGKGIISYDFTLNYDPTVLSPQPIAFDKTSTLSSGFQEINAGISAPGKLVVSGFGTVPLAGAGTLLKLKFTVIGTAPTSSALTLSPFMFNEGLPTADVTAGNVFVQGTISGRVTYGTSAITVGVPAVNLNAAGSPNTSTTTAADGTYRLGGFGPGAYVVTPSKTGDFTATAISGLDASLVSQFLVGATALTAGQQAAGEVSGNGSLTSFDAAQIALYVALLPSTGATGTWRFAPSSRNYVVVGSLINEDYSAILMGEVSGNWTSSVTGSFAQPMASTEAMTKESPLKGQQLKPSSPVATVTIASVKTKANQLVAVPVTVKFTGQTPSIGAYQFDVLFDPQVIQPDTVAADTAGTLSSGLSAITNTTLAPGRMRVVVYGSSPFAASGTLLNLRFRAVGKNGSSSSLSFANLLLNEGNPTSEGKAGKISISR